MQGNEVSDGMNDVQHLKRIRALPCVVCTLMGLTQTTETESHHLESVRDDFSDYSAVPLCVDHHRGANGIHGLSRRGFYNRHKLSDIDLLGLTILAFKKEGLLI